MKKYAFLLVLFFLCLPVYGQSKAVVKVKIEDGYGTGFVYKGRYIVTAKHVVNAGKVQYVRYRDDTYSSVDVIYTHDLVVLFPYFIPDDIPYLYPSYNHNKDLVYVKTFGIKDGKIISKNRVGIVNRYLIHMFSPLVPGYSGGPIVIKGTNKVIGIMKASTPYDSYGTLIRHLENKGFLILY